MKKSFKPLVLLPLAALLNLAAVNPALAKLKVVGAYPYIQSLVSEIGKPHVEVSALATGDWDPHFVVAKPSLLTRLRQAELLVINGAQLEIGWLPPLLRQSGNARIQAGSAGLLDLSVHVNKIQVPNNVSRAAGDVHPQGNPHFVLDPNNVLKMASAVSQSLCQRDAGHCSAYQGNLKQFKQRWQQAQGKWKQRMAPLKGKSVVEYHRLHDYFLNHYGLKLSQTLEPLPGIPPTPQHLALVVNKAKQDKVRFNLRGAYNPADPSQFVSKQTGIQLVTLPHDVGAVPEAKDLFGLYEAMLKRLGV